METPLHHPLGNPLDAAELRRAVAELLEADPARVGAEDNLVQLGLDSVRIMKFAVRLRQEAGAAVTFGELIGTPTLAAWTKLVCAAD